MLPSKVYKLRQPPLTAGIDAQMGDNGVVVHPVDSGKCLFWRKRFVHGKAFYTQP